MVTAEQFIDALERRRLLDSMIIESLRTSLAQARSPVSAEMVAQRLVAQGYISDEVAQDLLAGGDVPPRSAPVPPPPPSERDLMDEPELQLADDDFPAAGSPPAAQGTSSSGGSSAAGASSQSVQSIEEILSEDAVNAEEGAAEGKQRRWGRHRRPKNVWDSKLLLFGGGGLLLLITVAAALIWALNRRGAAEMFDDATDDYRAGSYTQAIAKYNDFIEAFPQHEETSLATVRVALSRIRQVTDSASDWEHALEVTREQIAQISGESAFNSEARPELAAILPTIAEGLAAEARESLSADLVQKTEESLQLLDKYVLSSSRPVQRIADVEAILALTRREIDKLEQLQLALERIDSLLEENDPILQEDIVRAYGVRRDLITRYPDLAGNEQLTDAVRRVSHEELAGVQWVDRVTESREVTDPPQSDAVMLVHRDSESEVPGATDGVILVPAEGNLYGLDMVSGRALWVRRIGYPLHGDLAKLRPLRVEADRPDSDAILLGGDASRIQRIRAASGETVWQAEPSSRLTGSPIIEQDQIWAPQAGGLLALYNLRTGTSPGHVAFPQEISVAPTFDDQTGLVYQVGDHSTLFVLSQDGRQALASTYIGHAPSSVVIAPAIVARYLVIAENLGTEDSVLKVLALPGSATELGGVAPNDGSDGASAEGAAQAAGGRPLAILQRIQLAGRVDTSLEVAGARLLVVTDNGDARVFQVDAMRAREPLQEVAHTVLTESSDAAVSLRRFAFFEDDHVWVADHRLTQYRVNASRGRLQPQHSTHSGSSTQFTPEILKGTIYQVRRRDALPGVWVTALSAAELTTYWETRLAVPTVASVIQTADAPSGSGDAGLVFSALGSVFEVMPGQFDGTTLLDTPVTTIRAAELSQPVDAAIPMSEGVIAMPMVGAASRMVCYDPEAPNTRLRWFALPAPISAPPVPFGQGMLAPCATGELAVVDYRSGVQIMQPLFPPRRNTTPTAWQRPYVVDSSRIIAADSSGRIYRAVVREQPTPHLAIDDEVQSPLPLTTGPVVLGDRVYLVDEAGSLLSYDIEDFEAGEPHPLSGQCTYGPFRVGDHVVLAASDATGYIIDADGHIDEAALPFGVPVGPPLATGDHWIFATPDGVVWSTEAGSLKQVGSVRVDRHVVTAPAKVGDHIVVGAADGAVYRVELE